MAKPEELPPIEQCDVLDRQACADFRTFRAHVHDMLVGEDDHSVSRQITNLLWRDYTWRLLNETRRKGTERGVEFNQDLLAMIDDGFVANQSLAVRRLVEEKSQRDSRSVYSIVTSIDEFGENAHLLTRENVVCYGGSRFDGSGNTYADRMSKHAHAAFNSVCDSPTGGRFDRVSTKFMRGLRDRLSPCAKMVTLANKRIAHASAPPNRGEGHEFSLDDLDRAYAAIIAVAQAISTRVLFGPFTAYFPIVSYDNFKHLDVAFLPDTRDRDVREWGAKRQKLYEEWGSAKIS